MVDFTSDDLRKIVESAMSNGDDDMLRETVIGSTAQWLADDPNGELKNTQVPAWGEHLAIRFILEPIVKRATFKNEVEAREGTPWHLMGHVLNMLARMELVRKKVMDEASRALELNSNLKKGKGKETEGGDVVLLPSEKRNTLRYLASPGLSTQLREKYMFISLQIRRMHIYEYLRTRTSDVDQLIKRYFPKDLTADMSNLYIATMEDATPEEVKAYKATRSLVYNLYQETDIWEDELQEQGITENMMNGLPQDPKRDFAYPEEFEGKFPPFMEWRKLVELVLGWSKTVLNMVTALDDAFKQTS